MRVLCLVTVALVASACDEDDERGGFPTVVMQPAAPETAAGETAPDPQAPAAEAADPTPTSHFNLGACTAGAAHELGTFEGRRGAAAVAFDSTRGGLVARTQDADHVEVRPLDPEGVPGEPRLVELVGARDLRGVFAVGDRYVVVTHALCPASRASNKCLNLRALSAEGAPVGDVTTEVTREWMGRALFEVAGDALVVLRSHTYIQPVLERYLVAEDGTITRSELGDVAHENEDGIGATAWGLAVDGDRWAALIRDESGDDERFFLHVAGAPAPVIVPLPILQRSTRAELAFDGDGLRMVIVLEGGARLARLGLDGSVAQAPRELSADEELADDRVVPVLSATRARTSFSRMDLGHRPIGDVLAIEAAGPSAVDGDGARFVVAAAGTRSEAATVTTITCAPR